MPSEKKIGPDIISKKKINSDKSHQTPFLKAIEYINKILNTGTEITPSDIIFFDDSDKNILSALDTGLKTVYIQKVNKNPITEPKNITINQEQYGNPDRSELSVFLDKHKKSLIDFINN